MTPIPVNIPLLQGREMELVQECIETGWISSEGPFVREFEEKMAARFGRKHAVAVCNGTGALDCALKSLQLQPGDEVIVPTFTIISCVTAVINAGAKPVLVDMDADTWNMTAEGIGEVITSRTRAILVVHIYGLPVDMDPVLELAEQYGLMVVEDAAEAIGQEYNGKACGSLGDVSIFSFYPNKHITTGEGGMVLTDDPDLAERCRRLRNLCFQPEKRFYHEEIGWNYRMTNLQAALGLAQLESLSATLERKREIGGGYHNLLKECTSLQLPLPATSFAENLYWVFGVILKEGTEESTLQLTRMLGQEKIGTRPFFWPMHEQPVFHKLGLFKNDSFPIAERLARTGFYLPSGVGTTDGQIRYVTDVLKSLL
jgi:perosamine synthetase